MFPSWSFPLIRLSVWRITTLRLLSIFIGKVLVATVALFGRVRKEPVFVLIGWPTRMPRLLWGQKGSWAKLLRLLGVNLVTSGPEKVVGRKPGPAVVVELLLTKTNKIVVTSFYWLDDKRSFAMVTFHCSHSAIIRSRWHDRTWLIQKRLCIPEHVPLVKSQVLLHWVCRILQQQQRDV